MTIKSKSINFEKISESLRRERASMKYTQKQLAKKADVDVTTIGKLEIDSKGVKVVTLGSIADALEVEIEIIIRGRN